MTTAQVSFFFPGFHRYLPRAMKCLAQGHSFKNPSESVITQEPGISRSQGLQFATVATHHPTHTGLTEWHSHYNFPYFINMVLFNPIPDDKILDWSKLKQIADDILKCFTMKNKCHIG